MTEEDHYFRRYPRPARNEAEAEAMEAPPSKPEHDTEEDDQ